MLRQQGHQLLELGKTRKSERTDSFLLEELVRLATLVKPLVVQVNCAKVVVRHNDRIHARSTAETKLLEFTSTQSINPSIQEPNGTAPMVVTFVLDMVTPVTTVNPGEKIRNFLPGVLSFGTGGAPCWPSDWPRQQPPRPSS